MNDPANNTGSAPGNDSGGTVRYYARDFWSKENLKFVKGHFRMEKAARIVNAMAEGKDFNLLDVGCGPATLMHLLDENVRYYGIDIAIHEPAPNLIEADFLKTPIAFGDVLLNVVLAQGVFEYVGTFQAQKFAEISKLLTPNGKFIVSYWNFGHRDRKVYPFFSNIQPLSQFRESLARHFSIDKIFPVGHNWRQYEPGRKLIKAAQMRMDKNIPFVSPLLAVEYFFICSPYGSNRT